MFKFIILLSLISSSTFAVITSKCSSSLNISMPEVQVFSRSFVQNQIKDYYKRVDFKSIENFIEGNFGQLTFKGELANTSNSVCVYTSTDLFNRFSYVRISGTDKKPFLVMDFYDEESETSLTLFANSTSNASKYDFSGATAQIKADAWGESWGDSYVVRIPLGKAVIK